MSCDSKQEKYYKKYMKYKQKYIEITTRKSVSDDDHSKIKKLVKSREWNKILKSIENINNLKNDINGNMFNLTQHDNKMNILMQNAFKLSELFDFIKQRYKFSDLEMFTLTDLYKKNLNPEPLFDESPFKLDNLFSITEDTEEVPEAKLSSCGTSILLEKPEKFDEDVDLKKDEDTLIDEHKHEIKDIDGLVEFLSKETDTEKEINIVDEKDTLPEINKVDTPVVPEPVDTSVVPEPVVADAVVPEPVVADAVVPEPVVPEPVVPEPVVADQNNKSNKNSFGNQLINN
jgi:hypothetical protein